MGRLRQMMSLSWGQVQPYRLSLISLEPWSAESP